MAITKKFFEAKKKFIQDYLIEKPRSYGVDFSVFSALTLAPREPTWAANIVGVGIGEKYRKGVRTEQIALRVYVVEKFSKEIVQYMPKDLGILESYEDVPTDVIAVGRPILRQVLVRAEGINTNYSRPVPGGFSIGNVNEPAAGTLGCLVKDKNDSSKLYILSNNHVIARQNSASSGEGIVQPGPLDGGVPPAIAEYEQRSDRVHTDSTSMNAVDAALGKVIDRNLVSPEISEIGRIKGITRATEKRWVIKNGRTTGFSRGYIEDANTTLKIGFASGIALFTDQILIRGVPSLSVLSAPSAGFITPFSAAGDSGSVILDEATGYAVGLLFAGSDRYNITYANKIENVLRQLNVELAT